MGEGPGVCHAMVQAGLCTLDTGTGQVETGTRESESGKARSNINHHRDTLNRLQGGKAQNDNKYVITGSKENGFKRKRPKS